MGKMILRILQVTFGVVGGLLIVPMAVNLETGGTAPPWLAPYIGWLWPAALGCVVLVILLELWDKVLRDDPKVITVRRPNDPHNYQLALAQVARYVDLRRRGSLAERVRVALALDERPAAVHQPAHLVQRVSGEAFQLSAGLGIGDVFDQMNESMLILGDPGSGKTTQLLDLMSALIARERAATPGTEPRIPVVVDLAGWSGSGRRWLAMLFSAADSGPRDFIEWLLASLRDRYHIPKAVGQAWLEGNRFTLLLDGLDEVGTADRERCVREINALQTRWGVTRLAVCSRTTDYDELSTPLSLQGAVVIRPLTREQVVAFFTEASPRLGGVLEALRDDPELWELLTSPLMLNIVALAYGDRAAQALAAEGDQAQRRARLFDAYVVEVLARRRSNEPEDAERALRAVRALARASTRLNAGVSVVPLNVDTVEKAIDPVVAGVARSWLLPAWGAACSVVAATAMGTTWPGLVAGILIWLFTLLVLLEEIPATAKPPRILPLVLWVLITTMSIMAVVLILRRLSLLLVNQPRLVAGVAIVVALTMVIFFFFDSQSWRERGSNVVAASGLLVPVLVLWSGVSRDALVGWAAGVGGTVTWLIGVSVLLVRAATSMDNGIAVRFISTRKVSQALLYTGAVVVAPIVLAGGWSTSSWSSLAGWLVGVYYGVIPAFIGWYLLLVPLQRPVYVIAGEPFPWRRALLRFAADRSLLEVVDGEYRFVHLLVRDYLAECDPRKLADQMERRRVELAARPFTLRLPPAPT